MIAFGHKARSGKDTAALYLKTKDIKLYIFQTHYTKLLMMLD